MSEILIHVGCDTVTVSSNDNDGSVLESLEKSGLEPVSQCKDGFCGACRVPIYKGSVIYPKAPIAYVGAREILPCCCKPDGDIEISL